VAKITEADIRGAVDEVLETIDEHDYAGSDVPRSVRFDFFAMLIESLKAKMKDELEDSDDEDVDEVEDDDG
jgi:fructose-1-phosphate kinase PfkB-like protein